MDEATTQNDRSVENYIASLDDEQTLRDSQVLIDMMRRISGHEPKLCDPHPSCARSPESCSRYKVSYFSACLLEIVAWDHELTVYKIAAVCSSAFV
jgi:hypothetical protein